MSEYQINWNVLFQNAGLTAWRIVYVHHVDDRIYTIYRNLSGYHVSVCLKGGWQ